MGHNLPCTLPAGQWGKSPIVTLGVPPIAMCRRCIATRPVRTQKRPTITPADRANGWPFGPESHLVIQSRQPTRCSRQRVGQGRVGVPAPARPVFRFGSYSAYEDSFLSDSGGGSSTCPSSQILSKSRTTSDRLLPSSMAFARALRFRSSGMLNVVFSCVTTRPSCIRLYIY